MTPSPAPVLLAALGLVLALAACSSSSLPRPVPSSQTPPTSTARPTSDVSDVRDAPGGAAFVSPSGRIACLVDAEFVRCEYSGEKAWTTPEPDGCELDWGSEIELHDVAYGGCIGDTVRMESAMGSTGVGWHRTTDPTVISDGTTLAVLPYGSALTVGTMRCDSVVTGVTCRNLSTNHGFSMAREAYAIF